MALWPDLFWGAWFYPSLLMYHWYKCQHSEKGKEHISITLKIVLYLQSPWKCLGNLQDSLDHTVKPSELDNSLLSYLQWQLFFLSLHSYLNGTLKQWNQLRLTVAMLQVNKNFVINKNWYYISIFFYKHLRIIHHLIFNNST